MTYQPQHEVTISPYPFGGWGGDTFIFGALCACGWIKMPGRFATTTTAIREHYEAVDFAVKGGEQR